MGVMREQKKKERKRKEKGERESEREEKRERQHKIPGVEQPLMSFAGSKLNVQLTEGKALFHGGNMKVDVQSEFSARKRGGEGGGG